MKDQNAGLWLELLLVNKDMYNVYYNGIFSKIQIYWQDCKQIKQVHSSCLLPTDVVSTHYLFSTFPVPTCFKNLLISYSCSSKTTKDTAR